MAKFFNIAIGVLVAIFVALAGLLVVSALKEPEEEVVEEVEVTGLEEVEPVYYYPLSGTEVTDAGNPSNQKPIAVVIENSPEARPQSGLEEADIVFEFLAESSITRFVAIYQSESPGKVGPVRSARPYFLEVAKGYDAFFVAHGYSDTAEAMLNNEYIEHINGMQYEGVYFERDSSRSAPHNSYTSGETIDTAMADLGVSTVSDDIPEYKFYTEDEMNKIVGEQTTEVHVSYGSSTYDNTFVYDAATGSYTRYVDGEVTVDRETGEPVWIQNIMVIEAPHSYEENGENRVIDMTTGGRGYMIQQGVIYPIQWENVNGKITPYVDGVEVKLVPGKTWINVIPASDFDTAVTYEMPAPEVETQ